MKRPTENRPTKSAVLGLVAAAMGVDHDQRERLLALEQGLGFAVRTDRAGVRLRDYHTTQVLPRQRGVRHRSRKAVLERDPRSLQAIISTRDYLCDGHWTVCLWPRAGADEGQDLDRILAALREPVFTPFLGRKSCPFSFPMAPQIVDSRTLKQAFSCYTLTMSPLVEADAPVALHWDGDHPDSGFEAQATTARRDALANPVNRGFHVRVEQVTDKGIPPLRAEDDGCT